MPPKPIPTGKGQTNLFSFFNKAKPASPTTTGTSDAELAKCAQASVISVHSAGNCTPIKEVTDPVSVVRVLSAVIVEQKLPEHDLSVEESGLLNSKKRPVPAAGRKLAAKQARTIVDSDDEEWDGNDNVSAAHVDTSQEESDYSNDEEDDEDSDDSFIVNSDSDDDGYAGKKNNKKRKLSAPAVSNSLRKPPLPTKKRASQPGTLSTSARINSVMDCSPATSVSSTPLSQRSSAFGTPSSAVSKLDSFVRRTGSFGDETEASGTPPSPSMAHHLLLPEGVVGMGSHEHNSWEFLKPSHRKDKNGRRPDHPEYNPRTLVSAELPKYSG
jgi:hypothetical protein